MLKIYVLFSVIYESFGYMVLVTVYIPANTMMKAPENMHKVSHFSSFPIHEFSVKTCEMICLVGNNFLNFDISQVKATNKPYPEEERKGC